MNDFEAELRELIEKHREFPGADLRAMGRALVDAGADLMVDGGNQGPHAPEYTGL